MAQIIDVPELGGPTLFSPVPAHALEPGDLFHADDVTERVISVSKSGQRARYLRIVCASDVFHTPINSPVLRAVGARASRGGAR